MGLEFRMQKFGLLIIFLTSEGEKKMLQFQKLKKVKLKLKYYVIVIYELALRKTTTKNTPI